MVCGLFACCRFARKMFSGLSSTGSRARLEDRNNLGMHQTEESGLDNLLLSVLKLLILVQEREEERREENGTQLK